MRMRFGSKVAILIALTSGFACAVTGLVIYKCVAEREKKQFVIHHEKQIDLIIDTLRQLEQSSNEMAENALAAWAAIEGEELPSNEALAQLGAVWHVDHLFVTDHLGHFLRSTNGDPANFRGSLFDFCPRYTQIIQAPRRVWHTPIMPIEDESSPGLYKYSMVANQRLNRILEVSVSAENIVGAINKSLRTDPDLRHLSFSGPAGKILTIGTSTSYAKSLEDLSYFKSTLQDGSLLLKREVVIDEEQCCECESLAIGSKQAGYRYLVSAVYSTEGLQESLQALMKNTAVVLGFAWLVSGALGYVLSRRLVSQIEYTGDIVRRMADKDGLRHRVDVVGSDEIAELGLHINRMAEDLQRNVSALVEVEKARSVLSVAQQVAHDIRSPLTALAMVSREVGSLPEDSRIVLRTAVRRIQDIANNLLHAQDKPTSVLAAPKRCQIVTQIESILSEKRAQYRALTGLSISFEMMPEHYPLSSVVVAPELKRVLSNVINNAVEALREGGEIRVDVVTKNDAIVIRVVDNGCGMSAETLKKLGQRGFTQGKKAGLGIGLHHAGQTLQRWGGGIRFDSAVMRGTTVEMTLPKVPLPQPILEALTIRKRDRVLVLDDDPSIHAVWEKRLGARGVELIHMSCAHELDTWLAAYRAAQKSMQHVLLLTDYELSGQALTGVDIIEQHGLREQAILVTSHFEDHAVWSYCEQASVKILPKQLVPIVPMKVSGMGREAPLGPSGLRPDAPAETGLST